MSPTRTRVLRFLEAGDQPLAIADIAAALDLAENTVRYHLASLQRDGLATSEVRPDGQRGRPRLRFRSRPIPGGPYERLALALLRARQTGESLEQAGEAVAPDGNDVIAFLTAEGFSPAPDRNGAVLTRCPLAIAVANDPAAVCAVHRGLVTAIAARGGERVFLVPDHPGHCRITCGTRLAIGKSIALR
jgi:predicted ArsR family transcriptional regulator